MDIIIGQTYWLMSEWSETLVRVTGEPRNGMVPTHRGVVRVRDLHAVNPLSGVAAESVV